MASPQPDKFTKISSELLEAFCKTQLSGSEWSFIHALLRKTYGYNKKEDWITNTQIMEMTGLCKERVSEAKRSLIAKKIVTEKRNKIGLQKDYELWAELRKNVTKVTEKRNSELRKNVTTIDNIDNRHLPSKSSGSTLIVNQEKMWNKVSDDFEGELQIDPDHTPKGKKKVKKVSDDVQAVFELFNNPAAALWRMREIERVAAQALYDTYGLDKLKVRVNIINEEKQKKDPYFPDINTPSQLLDKMPNVERYLNI